jgi:hypothetical protein
VVRQFAVRFPYIIRKLAQKNLQKSYFKKCLSLRSIKKHQNPIKLNQSVRGPICSKISLYNPQIGPPQKTKPIYSNQYHKLVLILGIISLTSTQSKHSKDNILKKKSAAFFLPSVCKVRSSQEPTVKSGHFEFPGECFPQFSLTNLLIVRDRSQFFQLS